MKTVIALILAGVVSLGAEQMKTCPNGVCKSPVVETYKQAPTITNPAQKLAYFRARYMASKGIVAHVYRHLGFAGGRVEGVGFSSTNRVPTCTPCGNGWCEGCRKCVCIGDSGPIRGRKGWYRCRIFK